MRGTLSKVAVINAETQEVLPDFVVSVSNRRHSVMARGGFFMVDQTEGADLLYEVAASRLPGEAFRVLFVMLRWLDYENNICISHAHIAQACGISRPAVSRSIKRLVEVGLIRESLRVPGGAVAYTLNPRLVWKGKGDKVKRSGAILAFHGKRADAVPA